MDLHAFEDHLVWAEGEKLFLYRDSVGIQTIGVGHNIEEKGISKRVSRLMLKDDIQEVVEGCRGLDYWNDLDSTRQLVVADMVFNLGLPRFLNFKKLNAALALGDYSLAAHEMEDSRWYRQVGRRAVKLQKAMITGEWNA
jgi:lysozyme